ncbi:selenocysteine insertion sequence-binding protein 2-like [Dysidea avara]|uniref:selenocysteine insertion sequence-binding protein 2-like n=1 Tax=Dysidea avara TaxID=196820 RepID=UPI0033196EE9
MTDLALKADKEGANPSLAKGEVEEWTTVSRKNLRGRPVNATDDAINERRLLGQNQSGNKTQHKYQGGITSKHHSSGPSHVKILRRNNSTDGGTKEISSKEGDNRNGNYTERHKTGGILRIPDMNMLAGVASSGDRWREFNTTNEMWPSIDANKDDNNELTHSKVKSYSSIVRTAPPPAMTTRIEDRKGDSNSGSTEEDQATSEVQKKKKKKKKKKKASEEERRTDKPVTIDFGSFLDIQPSVINSNKMDTFTTNTDNTTSAPKKLLLTTTTPIIPSLSTNKPVNRGKEISSHAPHNMLDSTAPLVKRGKERETPAKKRPSALKKVILKEREEKKRLRDLEDSNADDVTVQLNMLSVAHGAHDEEATQVTPGSHDSHSQEQPPEECVADLQFSVHNILPSQKPKQLHSRKFREYCDHMLSPEIDNCVTDLLSDLHRFQTRAYLKDPIKARAKRRYVLGLREVTKHLRLKKVKCVIASPNMERIQSTGGIDEMLMQIIKLCTDYNITMVYALNRKKMGGILRKKVPVSIVGIFSYDGAEQYYKKMVQLVSEKRELYRDKLQALLQAVTMVTTEQEGEGDSPCDDDILCDVDEEQTDQFLDENDDVLWDPSLFQSNTIPGAPLSYYYIPTYYPSSSSHSHMQLNINAPEFVPSWRYS